MNNEKTTVPQETEQAATPLKLDVTARLIEPKGNLVGFASLKLNDCFVIDDFKILQSDKGTFVGIPKQLAEGAKQAAQENAARPAPAKAEKVKNAER